jgi:hypothetical protein
MADVRSRPFERAAAAIHRKILAQPRRRISGTFAPTSQPVRVVGLEQPLKDGFSMSPLAHIDRSIAPVELGRAVWSLAAEVKLANANISVVSQR